MLEQWLVLLDVILGPKEPHPAVYKLSVLVEAEDEISARLHVQTHHQPDMPVNLIHLVQTELNKSYWKVFMSVLPVRWPLLVNLSQTLTNGHFSMDIVAMPGHWGKQQDSRKISRGQWENHHCRICKDVVP